MALWRPSTGSTHMRIFWDHWTLFTDRYYTKTVTASSFSVTSEYSAVSVPSPTCCVCRRTSICNRGGMCGDGVSRALCFVFLAGRQVRHFALFLSTVRTNSPLVIQGTHTDFSCVMRRKETLCNKFSTLEVQRKHLDLFTVRWVTCVTKNFLLQQSARLSSKQSWHCHDVRIRHIRSAVMDVALEPK